MKLRGAMVLVAVLPLLLFPACRRAPEFHGEVVEPAQEAPDLAGTNRDGQPFRLRDHAGKVRVVFFGYTFCPDVCPFTLAKMKQLYGRLGERAGDLEVVFVSVDPKRDSVEKLATYVPAFDRRFYGLHIPEEKLEAAIQPFGATVRFGAPSQGLETESFYLVDHTGTYFVVDRQGMLRLKFPPNATVDQMLPDVEKLLASGAPSTASADHADRLEIRQARALLTSGMGAAYFSVFNPGSESDRLLRVETSAARVAETHETLAVDGVMRMEPRPGGFEIPAGETLELKPGGKHVMLIEPRPAAAAGEIPLTLHFERAGAIEVRAKILDPAEGG